MCRWRACERPKASSTRPMAIAIQAVRRVASGPSFSHSQSPIVSLPWSFCASCGENL